MFCAFDEVVDSSLPEEIGFCFFARTNLAICRALVHPIDSIYSLLATCFFELPLQLLLGALFFDFIDALLGALTLREGLLLLIPDGLLISS